MTNSLAKIEPSEVAARIRLARRNAGLSQRALATLLGVQRSAVANWEASGSTLPSISHLLAIAAHTNASLDWLSTGRAPSFGSVDPLDEVPAADATFTETPQEKFLLLQFRRIPSKAQLHLLELLHMLGPARLR